LPPQAPMKLHYASHTAVRLLLEVETFYFMATDSDQHDTLHSNGCFNCVYLTLSTMPTGIILCRWKPWHGGVVEWLHSFLTLGTSALSDQLRPRERDPGPSEQEAWCGPVNRRSGVAQWTGGLVWPSEQEAWCGPVNRRSGVAQWTGGLVWPSEQEVWCGPGPVWWLLRKWESLALTEIKATRKPITTLTELSQIL